MSSMYLYEVYYKDLSHPMIKKKGFFNWVDTCRHIKKLLDDGYEIRQVKDYR